jgi:hypothetical protein
MEDFGDGPQMGADFPREPLGREGCGGVLWLMLFATLIAFLFRPDKDIIGAAGVFLFVIVGYYTILWLYDKSVEKYDRRSRRKSEERWAREAREREALAKSVVDSAKPPPLKIGDLVRMNRASFFKEFCSDSPDSKDHQVYGRVKKLYQHGDRQRAAVEWLSSRKKKSRIDTKWLRLAD